MRIVKLVRFTSAGAVHVGLVRSGALGHEVLDLGAIDPVSLLADRAASREAQDRLETASTEACVALEDCDLVAPLTPRTIICTGYNFAGHLRAGEQEEARPGHPEIFLKSLNTVRGPRDTVELPSIAHDVDYEAEVAAIIGFTAHRVSVDAAEAHIVAYTILNDVSARDWQERGSQWTLGKCFDGFAPLGPMAVTPDELPNTRDLHIEVHREGLRTVSHSTSAMHYGFAELVSMLSQVITLMPGDLIAGGSPQKLPEALAAHRPLADGDSVTISVSGLGALTTRFRKAER